MASKRAYIVQGAGYFLTFVTLLASIGAAMSLSTLDIKGQSESLALIAAWVLVVICLSLAARIVLFRVAMRLGLSRSEWHKLMGNWSGFYRLPKPLTAYESEQSRKERHMTDVVMDYLNKGRPE